MPEPMFPQSDSPTLEQAATINDSTPPSSNSLPEDAPLEEFEEELIIEDFTIDGICGVY